MDRREFVKLTAGAAIAAGIPPVAHALSQDAPAAPGPDAAERDLVLLALDAVRSAGAAYADVRLMQGTVEIVSARERQITGINRADTYGIGIRALVGGSWGFAATNNMSRDAVAATAKRAAAIAAGNDRVNPVKTELAPVSPVRDGRWMTPHQIDPFTVPIEQKADLLFRANEEALRAKDVRFVTSVIRSFRDRRLLGTTDNTLIQQPFLRLAPDMTATAVSDTGDFQTRSARIAPRGAGWEYILERPMTERARLWAEQASEKLRAAPVEPGVWDLVLHPSHLWLTIHESIGHPTELDRAMGYEANYAGTSFVSPADQVLNRLKYGPAFMTVQGNRTEPGGCATCGWDDEGVPAQSWAIIDKGLVVNYQTTREMAGFIAGLTNIRHSLGTAYGQDWASIPFQRMPNVSLQPGSENLTEDDVIGATRRGIFIEGDGSFSIDQQRYNFQFGGQVFWEIRDGKKVRMIRDVAYQSRTLDFWNSLAMLGGRGTYELGAALNDGKGQPGQSNAVSHGCPVALFRNVNVLNTA
jgi:TldD protein